MFDFSMSLQQSVKEAFGQGFQEMGLRPASQVIGRLQQSWLLNPYDAAAD